MSNVPTYDPLNDLAKNLGCDYIRLLPDYHRTEPDMIGTHKGWSLGNSTVREKKMFSPEFEWKINGKRFVVRLTPRMKKQGWGSWLCGAEYDEFDTEKMHRELIRLIKQTTQTGASE